MRKKNSGSYEAYLYIMLIMKVLFNANILIGILAEPIPQYNSLLCYLNYLSSFLRFRNYKWLAYKNIVIGMIVYGKFHLKTNLLHHPAEIGKESAHMVRVTQKR